MIGLHLIEADEYYKTLLKEVPRAKKRIVIAAMVVLWGERTAPIFIMLQDAIKRGVKVTVLLDNYTKLTYLLGLKPRSSGKERLGRTFRALEDLSAQGAKIYSFGKLGFPPQKGRCHLKVSIVDNISYCFGGINFLDEALDQTDYMLSSSNPEVADCLEQLVKRIITTKPPLNDGEVKLDKNTSVLFDGGRPRHSLIYERACELSAQAKRIYFVGKMTPSGQLAKLLNEAGGQVYSNRPEQMSSLEGIGQAFDQQKYRIDNSYKGTKYIHSKTILFEMPSGRKELLSGSHNFSYRGVSFGTQEVAIHSKDPGLWDELYSFINKRVIKPSRTQQR